MQLEYTLKHWKSTSSYLGPKNKECTSQDGTVDESEPLGQFANQFFSNM